MISIKDKNQFYFLYYVFAISGLLIGLVFGQVFDNGLRTMLRSPTHASNVRLVFFKTVFQTLGYLAKADGVVSAREVQVARDIMLNDFHLDKSQMLMAINFFNEGKSADFNLNKTLTNFKNICGKYVDLRRFFLEILVKAALADKVLRESQRGRLVFICNAIGINLSELEYQLRSYGYSYNSNYHNDKKNSHSNYNTRGQNSQNYSSPDKQLQDAYNLLGVKSSDSTKVIKTAYRKLMSKYHPDKLVAKGLPPEMMNMAKEKTQQVASAYALVMRRRE